MARAAGKLRQDIYVLYVTEWRDGIDRKREFSTPVKYRLSVSATADYPGVFTTGIVPDYDREITVFKEQFTGFSPEEGTFLYVDKTPEFDEHGDLLVDQNGEPTVKPDYVLVRKLSTARGRVAKFGIKRVSYGNDSTIPIDPDSIK